MPSGTLESNFEIRVSGEVPHPPSAEEQLPLDPAGEAVVSALKKQLENNSVEELLLEELRATKCLEYEIPIGVKATKSVGGNSKWGICQGCDCGRMARLLDCKNGVT